MTDEDKSSFKSSDCINMLPNETAKDCKKFIQQSNEKETNQTRTLKDCTKELGSLMGVLSLSMDLTDSEFLELKSYIVNICNFQYEKTGIYPEIFSNQWDKTITQNKQEYDNKTFYKLSPELRQKLLEDTIK